MTRFFFALRSRHFHRNVSCVFTSPFLSFQYFLDRLYTTRISTRMLINQHVLCFANENGNGNGNGKKVSESSTGQVEAFALLLVLAEWSMNGP